MSPSRVLLMTCLSLIGLTLANGEYLCGSTLKDVMSFVCGRRGHRARLNDHKLIEDCCLNVCDYEYLESYCNPSPRKHPRQPRKHPRQFRTTPKTPRKFPTEETTMPKFVV
ncbi:PREDICTED: insulin-like peptide [Branchiostoma belcheri]|uniref:Insulin-like peptide n=1 Tax=Branchiostoma belcheri TaxID=7741 RepID=A0A6P4ZKI6_BRABE|nr:PREDICTED: insulin-like peptide [Branchiostoma belcheri]